MSEHALKLVAFQQGIHIGGSKVEIKQRQHAFKYLSKQTSWPLRVKIKMNYTFDC